MRMHTHLARDEVLVRVVIIIAYANNSVSYGRFNGCGVLSVK